MKVSDLDNVNEIDQSIQSLLGELSNLYAERERLFKSTKKSSKPRKRPANISEIDFSTFDLNLHD